MTQSLMNPGDVFDLFQCLLNSDPAIHRPAEQSLADWVARLPIPDYPRVDAELREVAEGWRGTSSLNMTAKDVRALARRSSHPVASLGVISFHRNGFIREAAIQELAGHRDGKELPFLLLRVNDWVGQVRQRADQALRDRLSPEYAPHFVASVALVTRLETCGREDHGPLVERIKDLVRPYLLAGLASPDRTVRRTCVRWALETPFQDEHDLMSKGLKDEDIVVRRWVARFIRESRTEGVIETHLASMKTDRCAGVRMEALLAAAEHSWHSELEVFLMDPSMSVRSAARTYLNRAGWVDFREFYRAKVRAYGGGEAGLDAALQGLSETGGPEDADLILPFCSHERARVVKVCARGLGMLDGDRHGATFLALIEDPRPGVARAAAEQLAKRTYLVPAERVWGKMARATTTLHRVNLLRVLDGYSKWIRLTYLLKACSIPDEGVVEMAVRLLAHWMRSYNAIQTQATKPDLLAAGEAFVRVQDLIALELKQELEFVLRAWTNKE